MNRFLTNVVNLTAICHKKTFARNQFKKSITHLVENKNEIDSKKAEVEEFRRELWRKHDKIFYYGAFTFVMRKHDEQKEFKDLPKYQEEEIKKRSSNRS